MSERVLVIDDEASLRTMIKLTLTHSGYSVETAANGSDGLAKFADGKNWDLVLVDQRMPGMTGIDLQREVLKRCANAKLILITGFGSIDLALEAIQAGASDFLRKPFTSETLRSAVKAALCRPAHRMSGVPVGMACKEFTRTTLNGYSIELDDQSTDDDSGDVTCVFQINHPSGCKVKVRVVLHAYVIELVKALTDSESVPGDNQFWRAMCEEALADFLWQNAEPPPSKLLEIEDVSSSLQRWLDSVLTVSLTEDNGRQ